MNKHRFPYNWNLKDAVFTKDKGKVFSCFACGGGSSFGYKLAGFDVIGMNEIDPKMAECYIENHHPKYAFIEPIQTFKDRDDLPQELYNLDILDGSPPCSSFSMAGNRDKDWGKDKKFREGQSKQVLDTLFFDFIDLAKKLQPKIVVAENVKGLLLGDAIEYVRKIYTAFDEAGYYCQHWLLNAAKMGVPQRRERVFFVCLRKDLAKPFLKQMNLFEMLPELKLEFDEEKITFGKIIDEKDTQCNITKRYRYAWDNKIYGDNDLGNIFLRLENKEINFSHKLLYKNKICPTLTATALNILFDYPRSLNDEESMKIGSYPHDYNFIKCKPRYLIGMSVPPVMMANIATEIYEQWLRCIND